MRSTLLAAVGAAVLAFTAPAMANTIYTFGTGPNGNANQSGTAVFDFGATGFTLTLENTGNITSIASLLDDFSFNLTGSLANLTLTSISEQGVVTCVKNTGCTMTGPGLATGDWHLTTNGNEVLLVAGQGEHPFGIVNDSILTNFGLDGLTNAQHNPTLMGPVMFTFSLAGEAHLVSNTVFSFGTEPAYINGVSMDPPPAVVEPASVAILGVGLLGIGFVSRRKMTGTA